MALRIAVIAVGLAMLTFAYVSAAIVAGRDPADDEDEAGARPIVILDSDLPRRQRKRG